MDTLTVEVNDEDLMRCDKLSQIVPHIYYGIQQLKALDTVFKKNDLIKQTELSLLAIYPLLEIKESDASEYVQQYRDLFTKALNHLSEFIIQLEQITISDEHYSLLSIILNDLAKHQKEITSIIDE